MQKRQVIRYETKSSSHADENQRRIEAVFAELEETQPHGVTYFVFRLADDSFVHVSFHDQVGDEVNPIASSTAFAQFQAGHEERRRGDLNRQVASLVGAYVTTID
jgi:hypothetical protein